MLTRSHTAADRRGDAIISGGRYRRVRSRLWVEPAFVGLSDAEKLVALYMLSGPQTTATGVYRLSPASAAEDLKSSTPAFQRRLALVLHAFGWHYDADVRVLWIPNWIEENPPQNPNQVQSWRSAFDEIPTCALKVEATGAILAFLESKGEPFAKPFREPFGKPLRKPFANGSPNGLPNTPDPDPERETIPATIRETVPPTRLAKRLANAQQNRRIIERLGLDKATAIEEATARVRAHD
jgi:hypothetical protein